MKVSIHELECHFRKFNELYFNGWLQMPKFKIIHSYKMLGYFDYQPTTCGGIDPCISITDGYGFTYNQLRDILVHEMIHYYLAFSGQDVYVNHGNEFLNMARNFNYNYGTNITVTYNTLGYYKIKQCNFLLKVKDFLNDLLFS